jgi:CRP-like cAMP-binding protein
MAVKSEVELLRQVPLFAEVEPAQLQLLVFNSRKRRIAPGHYLVKAGERDGAAHLILAGEAEALEGEEVIARLGRGAFVGELGMVANVPATVSVRATSPLEALRIGSELFQRVCREFPEDGDRMLRSLSERLDVALTDLRDVQALFAQARSFSRY